MGNAKSLIMKSRIRKLNHDSLAALEENEDIDFNRHEIEEWYKEFQLHLDKGITKLTVDVFKMIYNRVFDGDASSFAYHLFRSFDTNGDGYVDFKEFLVGLSVSSSHNNDKKLKWAFKMYDIDGNGLICKDEMVCVLKVQYLLFISDFFIIK
jgi:Ca2+-binding EF-hand superfamily protein